MSTKAKPLKTREELVDAGLRMYRAMKQNKEGLASGTITMEDLYLKASDWADRQLQKRTEQLVAKLEKKGDIEVEDAEYRETQTKAYRASFDWNDANDEASLDQLLDLELQIRAIKRELVDPKVDLAARNQSRRALQQIIAEHRALQKSLQIDRESREKKRVTKSTIDDWDRIKQDAKRKLDEIAAEFSEYATKCTTEAELRDRMKYHGALPFEMVDPILINHRRVLGLDLTLQES